MKTEPFFSVIINCHNSEKFLAEALNSVLLQTFKDFEVIVLDNASTDRTASIAKSFKENVKYFYSENKLSLGQARNVAISYASGTFLAFLDSDDTWLTNKLARQFEAIHSAKTDRKIGICGCDAMRVNYDLSPIIEYSKGRKFSDSNILLSLIQDCFIPMSSCTVSKEICESLGGFNENYEIIEEWDLWIRIAMQYELIYLDEVLANVRFHGTNTSKDYRLHFDEINEMLDKVEDQKVIDPGELQNIRIWFKLRYLLVDTSNALKTNKLSFFRSFFALIFLCMRTPKTSYSMAKFYFNPKLLKFFIVKYF